MNLLTKIQKIKSEIKTITADSAKIVKENGGVNTLTNDKLFKKFVENTDKIIELSNKLIVLMTKKL